MAAGSFAAEAAAKTHPGLRVASAMEFTGHTRGLGPKHSEADLQAVGAGGCMSIQAGEPGTRPHQLHTLCLSEAVVLRVQGADWGPCLWEKVCTLAPGVRGKM